MKKYIIYLSTSPSHKVYVGVTSKLLKERKSQHITRAKREQRINPFIGALRKYNYSFRWEILEEVFDLKEAELIEKYYIAFFNSTDRNFGYNLSPGGFSGKIQSQEGEARRKAKMAEYCEDPDYLKRISQSQKKRFETESVWNKGLTKENSKEVASIGEQNKINSLGNKSHFGYKKQFCKHGHDTFVYGRQNSSGSCTECHRINESIRRNKNRIIH